MADGQITIKAILDDQGVLQGFEAIEQGAEKAASKVGSGGKFSATAFAAASKALDIVVDKVGSLTGEMIAASDGAQKFASTLEFAGLDTSTIDRLTKSTQEYADKTVYDLNDIRSVTAQLASNGVKNFDSLAEAAGNLNAVAGGNKDTFKSVGLVMTQTAGVGKLTTENFRQLSDAIPGASGQLKQALQDAGAFSGSWEDAMRNGEISSDEFFAAVQKLGMTDVAKEAATSTATIEGAMGNLEASVVGVGAQVLDAIKPAITGAMDVLSDGISSIPELLKPVSDAFASVDLSGLRSAFDNLAGAAAKAFKPFAKNLPSLQSVSDVLGGALQTAVDALAGVLNFMADNADVISSVAVGLGAVAAAMAGMQAASAAATAIGAIVTGVQTLFAAMAGIQSIQGFGAVLVSLAGGLAPVAIAIAAVAAGLVWFFTQTEMGKQIWQGFTSLLGSAIQGAAGIISAAWGAITSTVSGAVGAVSGFVSGAWKGIQSLTSSVWNAIRSTTSGVWNGIRSTVSNVVNGIRSTVNNVWNGIKSTTSSIWNGIKSGITGAINGAKSVVQNAINTIKGVMNFKWSLPKLKLPHVTIKGGFSLIPPSAPSFDISWYAKGGVFNSPSVIGIGEGRDKEAALPLNKKVFSAIGAGISRSSGQNGNAVVNQTINQYITTIDRDEYVIAAILNRNAMALAGVR
ncbi:tape measure protein [uncultured Olegusella sp.]|uniref:tape measure protein n=1 Tax=uncultured Olegusella sp. TaxID=1979846 RepID=UPI00262E462E|nr:tape measure protein [uncultured Olegusella sp.]